MKLSHSSPPSPSSKLRLDWCRRAEYTEGKGALFVFGQKTPRGGTEGEEKRVILEEGARVVDAPPSLPPSFWITASKERGTMELVSLSLSSFRLSRIPVKQTAYLALSRQTAAIRRIINNTLHAAFDGRQTNSRAACGLSLANYRE